MIINIRGTNGSGKTTLAKAFLNEPSPVNLAEYVTAKGKTKFVEGTCTESTFLGSLCLVGSYKNACGGMDAIPNFALSREAIRKAATLATNVICEGILASTVFGSWATFARDLEHEGKEFAFVYLQTPVSVCLERIQARNGGKKINEKLVHDKVRAIAATREKVMSAGLRAFDLPLGFEEKALADIILGKGDAYVAE